MKIDFTASGCSNSCLSRLGNFKFFFYWRRSFRFRGFCLVCIKSPTCGPINGLSIKKTLRVFAFKIEFTRILRKVQTVCSKPHELKSKVLTTQ